MDNRLWWIAAVGVSLWLCTTLTLNFWNEWQENYMKMTFSLKETPISHITFPTVTICPEAKFMKTKFDLIFNKTR